MIWTIETKILMVITNAINGKNKRSNGWVMDVIEKLSGTYNNFN